ncbi:MAG TPA: class I SAM-dependent methyltransferase [Candidatus Polarisedimenticolaceae bacterium]|nr:class I SAM-dependent methyltransferase [Candidatus Polarisedimenticolaceae bacterium]
MAFRSRPPEPGPRPAAGGASPQASAGHPCGALGRAVARAFRGGKPEILILGPLCGESVVYLAGRGARVHVDPVDIPEPIPPRAQGETPPAAKPFALDHGTAAYDLVLAWEMLDFVPPDRLVEVGAEIVRVLRVGGQLFVFAHQKPPEDQAVPPRYRLLADDLIVREDSPGTPRRRYVHPNRDIERALAGLAVQGIQLQRNQMREILASKAGVG